MERPPIRYLAVGLFFLAFGIRLVYLLYMSDGGGVRDTGNAEMALCAASVARGEGFGNLYGDDAESTGLSAHISPVYALWLALIYKVFGYNTPAALFTQGILSILVVSLTAALILLVARRARLSRGAGMLAGLLVAVLPTYWFLEVDGAWEQPLTALALLILLWLCLAIHDSAWQSWKQTILFGFWIGFIALLHPGLLTAVVFFMLVEWITRPGTRGRILVRSCVTLAISGLVISPWIYRNYVVFDQFIPLRSNMGLELYIGNRPSATGRTVDLAPGRESAFIPEHPNCDPQERAHLRNVGEVEYMRQKKEAAVTWIRSHREEFLILTIQRFRWFWFPTPELWGYHGMGRYVNACALIVVAALCFASLFLLCWRRHQYCWIFLAVTLGPTIIYMITHVSARYRYPISAVSILLACELATRVINRIYERLRR
jgi:hypothetical protein